DEQEPCFPPAPQAIDDDGQKLHLVPCVDLVHAAAQEGRKTDDRFAEFLEPLTLHSICAALGNDIRALPVIAPIEHHQHPAFFDMTDDFFGIAFCARDAKPQ